MKKGVIFCVDDEKIILNGLKTELKNTFGTSYIIETAESGQEALEAIDHFLESNYEIPLIIADYAMPLMKGDELLTKVHKKSPGTLKILLTGQATVEGVTNAINNAGLYRYIAKPWDNHDLLLTVKQALISYSQTGQLETQNKQLTELSSSLEEKVKIRTQELQNANTLLLKTQSEITEQNKELEKYRNHLEKLVEERTKELTIAKEKAEESDRLKTAFLDNISHEIRTPLNAIVGFSGLIVKKSNDNELNECYNIIETQNELLLKIINDLIDFSILESGTLEIVNQDFNINNTIDRLLKILHPKCPPNVSLSSCIKPSGVILHADESRIYQIFLNLLSNAIKFTYSGAVTCGYDVVNDSEISFYVKDTGIGIPEDSKNKIFNRFTKLDPFSQGTGLGLSIVDHIIKLMDGKIEFESIVNQGTKFTFTIPAKAKAVEPEAPKLNGQVNQTDLNLSILVAEDNMSNYMLISKQLSYHNAKILHASNGQEAIDICRENDDIDLVLMDIKMPIVNGYEATEAIKKFKPDLPIIAQTAYALAEDRFKAKQAGFDQYIAKPIQMNLLIELIRNQMQLG